MGHLRFYETFHKGQCDGRSVQFLTPRSMEWPCVDELTEQKRLKIKPYVSPEAILQIVKLNFLLVNQFTF